MAECNSHENYNIYPNLGVPLSDQQQFRLNKINGIKDYFVSEIKKRELMSKRLCKYIASFDYIDKPLLVLLVTTGSISIAPFVTVIGAPVGIVSARFGLEFPISTGIIVMLAKSKLNNIESKISEALINNETSHKGFMTIINEEEKYRELKESIRLVNSQRSNVEKINLTEEGKKIGINQVIKRNEINNNSLET